MMNQRILVIDDSVHIHLLVKAILAQEPYEVHSAITASEGLSLAASLKPDLILLDVDMPILCGFDVCKRLKADPATAANTVVFLSGHDSPQERARGLALGAADYLTKPFSPDELVTGVRASLPLARAA